MHDKEDTTPKVCDRYQKCSANICPVDKDWRKRKHLKGERVCFYAIEVEKIDAEAVFRDSGRIQLYLAIKDVVPEIASCHYPIKYALEQAKMTGSRLTRKAGWDKNGTK